MNDCSLCSLTLSIDLQVNSVNPVFEPHSRFIGRVVSEQILRYWRSNEVDKFSFSRPLMHTNNITVSILRLPTTLSALPIAPSTPSTLSISLSYFSFSLPISPFSHPPHLPSSLSPLPACLLPLPLTPTPSQSLFLPSAEVVVREDRPADGGGAPWNTPMVSCCRAVHGR